MKKYITVFFLCSLLSISLLSIAFADHRYNSWTGRWENATSDMRVRYNSFDNSWSYQKPEATKSYNSWENKWEWNR